MYYTGVPACDGLIDFEMVGDITPRIWYQTIRKNTGKTTKPYFLAIAILAQIVAWYKPTAVRDGETDVVCGYRKKFKSDLLQKSYKDLARTFGVTKDVITDAVVFLETIGVIQRVFRTIEYAGTIINNVLYIKLNVEVLKELTYPSGDFSLEGEAESNWSNKDKTPSDAAKKDQTNTTVPTATKSNNYLFSEEGSGVCTHEIEREVYRLTEYDYFENRGVGPTDATASERECALRAYEAVVQGVIDILCKSRPVGTVRPDLFDSVVKDIVVECGDLCDFCYSAAEMYRARLADTSQAPVKNSRNYIQKLLYNYAPEFLRQQRDGWDI